MSLRPYVAVKLDQERRLRYNTDALISAEELIGKPIGQIVQEFMAGNFGMREARILLWAGLHHEMPDLTLAETSALIDTADFGELMKTMVEAMGVALVPRTEPKNVPGPRKHGTGKKHSD